MPGRKHIFVLIESFLIKQSEVSAWVWVSLFHFLPRRCEGAENAIALIQEFPNAQESMKTPSLITDESAARKSDKASSSRARI